MTDKFFFEAFLSIIKVIKHFKMCYLYRNAVISSKAAHIHIILNGARNVLRQ